MDLWDQQQEEFQASMLDVVVEDGEDSLPPSGHEGEEGEQEGNEGAEEEDDQEEEEEKQNEDGETWTRVRVQVDIYFTDEVNTPGIQEDAYFWKSQVTRNGVFNQYFLERDSEVQDKRRIHSIRVLQRPDNGRVRLLDIDYREDEENHRNIVRSEEKNTIVFEVRVGRELLNMNTSPGEVCM